MTITEDKKISELDLVATPAPSDEFAINQGGESFKQTRQQLHTLQMGEQFDSAPGTVQRLAANGVDGIRLRELSGSVIQSVNANIGLTADVGSSQGDGPILSSYNVYSVVANPGDAATLPDTFEANTIIYVKNDGANSMDVFPASGDDAGKGVDTAVSISSGSSAVFIATVADSTWTQLISGVSDPILLNDGSLGAPSYSFLNDPDTGMTRIGDGQVALIGNGTEAVRTIETAGVIQFGFAFSGDSSLPEITSIGDQDTGFRWSGGNEMQFVGGGSRAWNFSTGQFYSNFSDGPALVNDNPSTTIPTVLPSQSDSNTGLGSGSSDRMSLIAGGVEIAQVAEVSLGATFVVDPGATSTLANPALAFGDGDTGFYENVDDLIGVINNGVLTWLLGSSSFSGQNGNAPQLRNFEATSTNPSINPRRIDSDTGLGSDGDDTMSLVAGGVEIARITESVGADQFAVVGGVQATPGLSFLNDPDTGFFATGSNEIGVSIGGTRRWTFVGTQFQSDASTGPSLVDDVAGLTNANIRPSQSDGNTGIGGDDNDAISIIAGGVIGLQLSEASNHVLADWEMEDGITASITQTQGQQSLTSSYNSVGTVANPDDVVTMPSATIGRIVFVVNRGANDLQVFPASGDDLGSGVDTSVTIPAGESRTWLANDSTNWNLLGTSASGGGAFPLLAPNGSAGAPSYSFSSATSDGMFHDGDLQIRSAAGNIAFTALGLPVFDLDDTGLTGDNASPTWYLITDAAASSTQPVYAFNIDSNTGIGRNADDELSIIAGGIEAMRLTEAAGAVQALVVPGTVTVPSIGFIGDAGTGFYQDAATHTGWVSGGTEYWRFDDLSFQSLGIGAGLGQGPLLFNQVPSDTAPTLCPGRDDLDTGIGKQAADALSLIAGGFEGLRISEVGGVVQGLFHAGTAARPAMSFIDDPDTGWYRTTSGAIIFSSNGVNHWQLSSTAMGVASLDGPFLLRQVASATTPNIVPRTTDQDTGIGLNAPDELSIIAGGVEIARAIESTNDQFAVIAGAAAAPGMAFITDLDSGIFSQAADNVGIAAGGIEALRIEDPADLAASETSLWLYDDDTGAVVQVTVGANDSGGAGFKVLRIPN